MAVICGTPTPATTRVVQMEPGPMPTLTASAPASISASVALGGGDVAGDDLDVAKRLLDVAAPPRARRGSGRARCRPRARRRPASTQRVTRSLAVVGPDADRRRRPAGGPARPWWRSGTGSRFSMSLTVIRPRQDSRRRRRPAASRCGACARMLLGLVERGAHRRGDERRCGHDLGDGLLDVVARSAGRGW